ncbi:lysophospholipid acyltransferase family protein, partial [Klebsiella pneumoniae]|uniref:lysophospholipid acyltransferase family protein n=1 Tax=Klebsiella pneumoniae TaxID=573 RepID=UPI003D363D4A
SSLNTPEELEALRSPRQKSQSPARANFECRVMRAVAGRFEKASWDQCRRFGSRLGLAVYGGGRKRRELAIGNIQMALGVSRDEANRIARRSAQNWGMTTCEFLHLPAASREEICDYTTVSGGEHLQAAYAQGRGVILLMAHIGNWEMI